MTADDLLRWSRPDPILRDDERGRKAVFVQLFAEQLTRIATTPEDPLVTEVIAARRAAELLWTLDRATSDANRAIHRRVNLDEAGSHFAREQTMAEIELKARLLHIAQQELRAVDDLVRTARVGLGITELEEVA